MNAAENQSNRSWGLWVVLLLSVFAWAPALYPGYWQSLAGFAPVFNTHYPGPMADIAMVADIWRGTGGAAFLLTHPLTQLGFAPTLAVRIVFVLAIITGSVGVYVWLRPLFGDGAAGLAGLIYGFMPPLLTTIYVRGSLSDALVLGLLPLVLTGLTIYRFSRSPATIGLSVVALLWIWRVQAGIALLFSLLLLAYVLLVERDRLAALAIFVAGLAGLLSLVPFWGVRGATPVPFESYFLDLYGLLVGNADDIPFLLGFVPVGFSLVAAWLLWMRRRGDMDEILRTTPLLKRDQDRLLLFSFAAWIIALFLSLGASGFFWSLTGAERLLTYPGQVLLPVLPFLAATAGSLPMLSPALAHRSYWTALLAVVILSSFTYLMPSYTTYQPPELPTAVFGEGVDLVLLEATVAEEVLASEQGTAKLSIVWQPLQPLFFDYNVFFQALRLNTTGQNYEVIAQLDQQPLPDYPATAWQPGEILTATYTLALPIDPNASNLRYYFGYYNWQDNTRLPLANGNDDKVILYGE
jgi:hypothetical protein